MSNGKKNLIIIVNNYGEKFDGIGMYSKNLVLELKKLVNRIEIISGKTKNNKINSWELSINLLKFLLINYKKNIDRIFIIEYPFYEWNLITILILAFYRIYFYKNKFILSLHEYKRVNILRKVTIILLLWITDYNILTEEESIPLFKKKTIMKRFIPNNIKNVTKNLKLEEKNGKKYCFFGLINKSKAFEEMIEAWKEFNRENKYILEIYTATMLETFVEKDKYNIKIYHNLSNDILSLKLKKNDFIILPIKPNINVNNGTLMAALSHSVIPIGIFNKNLGKLGIEVEGEVYTKEVLKKALEKSTLISIQEKEEVLKNGEEFLKDKTFLNLAQNIKRIIVE